MMYARLLLRLVVDVGVSALEGLVSEEVRSWLDRLPRLILCVASRRLAQPEREVIYRDQWLPELARIYAAHPGPLTRLSCGVKFSFGILVLSYFAPHRVRSEPLHSSQRETRIPMAYHYLAQALRSQITDGKLPHGRPAPSITALSAESGYARATCAKALKLLEEQGLIRRIPGQGYDIA